MPLGVFALAQEEKGDAVMFFQISVNRAGLISGAYTSTIADDERPNVVGRQPFGRIHVANSDAAASAYTHAAIDEAHRAVTEILGAKETENAV